MSIESWMINMLLVAFSRPSPNRFIRDEARKALKGWAKSEDTTTKNILKMIIRCKTDRGLLLRTMDKHIERTGGA